MNDLVKAESGTQLISVIEKAALDPNVDVGKMEQLLSMQIRIMDKQSEAAFTAAFSLMQAELPSVMRSAKSNNNTYATFDDLMDAVREPAARHGFAISFEPDTHDGQMTIRAKISHRDGHKEVSTMTLPFETSGSKNAVQAIGSAQKYGMRYALVGMLGLSTHDGDDRDGDDLHYKITDPEADDLKLAADGYGLATGKIFGYYSKKFKCRIEDWGDLPAGSFDTVMAEIVKSGKAKAK